MAADKNQTDLRLTGRNPGAPVAALLFDAAVRPSAQDLAALSQASGAFAVTHRDDGAGQVELLRDGLLFDCLGLGPHAPLHITTPMQRVGLPGDFVPGDLALLTLSPGVQLTGAEQLLPVVRVLAGLVTVLAALSGVRAVAWLPARLAMSPAWFAEAIGAWLRGGPFPALALTGLVRCETGLASQGLAYFVGQEFVFATRDGVLAENDARAAVRLTDWLVAHGRVDSPCRAELTGFGTVLIIPDGPDRLLVRAL